jgi:hypothetical protein
LPNLISTLLQPRILKLNLGIVVVQSTRVPQFVLPYNLVFPLLVSHTRGSLNLLGDVVLGVLVVIGETNLLILNARGGACLMIRGVEGGLESLCGGFT